jgi:hypothetical protein
MRPKIPPEPIQPSFRSRSPRPRNLKHASRDLETSVGGDHLEAGDPFGKLAALLGCDLGSVGGVLGVDFVGFGDYFFG